MARKQLQLECGYCRKTYQKHEHLARHERTHTGQKPFACGTCGKAFARQDTLLRHSKVHQINDNICSFQGSPAETEELVHATSVHHENRTINAVTVSLPEPVSVRGVLASEPNDGPFSQLGPSLSYSDTDDFLQYFMTLPPGWSGSMSTNIQSPINGEPHVVGPAALMPDWDGQQADYHCEPSPRAVENVAAMITDSSINITCEIQAKGITSTFFDTCLYMFFARFNPTFPILHEATFVQNECSPCLLLKIVAIGSLFIGTSDAISKGEALWRLAQIAAATSWQQISEFKNTNDVFHGAQIVTTALLGQVYAMLSRSERLRAASQTLHGMVFSWAWKSGMYETEMFSIEDVPPLNATPTHKMESWKTWTVQEIHRRTVLALFIIDSQVAQFSGGIPSARHTTNSLTFASAESVFNAKTADSWILEINKHWQAPCTFKDVFLSLFHLEPHQTPNFASYFSAHVVLEGLEALVIENRVAKGTAVGIPSRYQISQALLTLKGNVNESLLNAPESMEFLLRWHAVFLDLATDTIPLCQELCTHYGIQQRIYSRKKALSPGVDLVAWAESKDARRALLHAIHIQDIAERLPVVRTHTTYIASSIFATAIVYCAIFTSGQADFTPPESLNWSEVWDFNFQPAESESSTTATASYSHSTSFVLGLPLMDCRTPSRNLRHSLHMLQVMIRGISSQWGISKEILEMLLAWTSKV